MRCATRNVLTGGAVATFAAGLFVVGAAFGAPGDVAPARPDVAQVDLSARPDPLADTVTRLQADLDRVPGNPSKWSELGLAYVQQARLSADPTLYAKADGAFAESLSLDPVENAEALTGQATLAAARHDFAEALALADAALAVNDFSATTYGVKVDALTELGRYDEALAAANRMNDLRPGADTYARLSYAYELRGDVERARMALEAAEQEAFSPSDRAFARFYLGELAFNSGDLPTARRHYDAALQADPTYAAARAGRAKALAAAGQSAAAVADYRAVVARLPQPSYVVELGELLEASGDPAAAQEQYAVVRAIQQVFAAQGADVDLELALFEADHGDPAAAVRFAEQAYRTRPDSILVQDAYAWALHAAGRDVEALPIARQAVRLGTPLAALYAHLGAIEAAAGEPRAARASLQRAVDLNPAFSPLLAQQTRALLNSLS